MNKSGNIETLFDLDTEFLKKEFIQKCKPVIIKGAIKNWPAFAKWNIEYLIQNIGKVLVKFKCANDSLFPNPNTFDGIEQFLVQETTFAEYLKLLTQNNINAIDKSWFFLNGDEVCFVEEGLPNDQFNIIASDFSLPLFIPDNNLETIGLWVSKRGTASSIHYDSNGCHNFNAQIQGSKRVVLFEPKEYQKLYMRTMTKDHSFHNFSNANWRELNYNKFPDLKDVQYIEGILEPGDALFTPVFWLHYFDHLGEMNINVNFWWQPTEINLNPVSLSWLLGRALAEMSQCTENLSQHDSANEFSKLFPSEEMLNFSKKLERIFHSWSNGRPGRLC